MQGRSLPAVSARAQANVGTNGNMNDTMPLIGLMHRHILQGQVPLGTKNPIAQLKKMRPKSAYLVARWRIVPGAEVPSLRSRCRHLRS